MTIQITGDAKEIAALVLAIQERRGELLFRHEQAPEETHTLTVDEMARPNFGFLRPEDLPQVLATESDTPTGENH